MRPSPPARSGQWCLQGDIRGDPWSRWHLPRLPTVKPSVPLGKQFGFVGGDSRTMSITCSMIGPSLPPGASAVAAWRLHGSTAPAVS